MADASQRPEDGPADLILAMVARDGTAASPHAQALADAGAPLRDLADAIHALCVVHGTFPGLVDHAAAHGADSLASTWMARTAGVMASERALLVRLAAAAGPLPSTPGQASAAAAILQQRDTLALLARSDRLGCATGATAAFVLDWIAVRDLLERCAERLGETPVASFAAVRDDAVAMLRGLALAPPGMRALTFGADQLLRQHRGLWQLLESRAAAREG
ncbi:DUF6975 family protein [Sphingomonas sp. BK580]|uniref:DUF6975 family protein n=1 Tax=Sphingomonas sp. BK580 TaxID=2586972 RepID=UPI001617E084|nr:hypothetical protein [Sphingomonas sp. BK580]MBB3692626.1 hypothetical protein [Sphingomonas sp. BK580]